MQEDNASTKVAPYLPFKTFLSSIEAFDQGLPRKIDRTIWRSQSGLNQGLIMGAFRFFELVDEDDRPSHRLVAVIEKKEQRKTLIRQLLETFYSDLLSHDLTKMTFKMLDDEIEKYGVTGSTKDKAISFFLQAAKYADMPLSPFLQRQVRTPSPRKRRASRKADDGENGDNGSQLDDNGGSGSGSTKEITLKSSGTITLKISADVFSLSADDRKFVFELIDRLQAYEKETASK